MWIHYYPAIQGMVGLPQVKVMPPPHPQLTACRPLLMGLHLQPTGHLEEEDSPDKPPSSPQLTTSPTCTATITTKHSHRKCCLIIWRKIIAKLIKEDNLCKVLHKIIIHIITTKTNLCNREEETATLKRLIWIIANYHNQTKPRRMWPANRVNSLQN